jgi:FtsP/CotA-like multicopper oxidase with cupredoxin domain
VNLDGVNRQALTINGNIPGPTINVDLGNAIHVHVINNLTSNWPISFHWYGLPMTNYPNFDGVSNITECPACPGDTTDYIFCPDVTGTFWYHSTVDAQRVDGLFGSIIVVCYFFCSHV